MLYLAGNHSTVWELRRRGLNMGWLMSPGCERRPIGRTGAIVPYAVDNGLFRPFGAPPAPETSRLGVYELLCKTVRLGWHPPLWYVVPDVPYRGEESLRLSREHAPVLRRLFPRIPQAIAVQDGMRLEDAEGFEVVFVAGSTAWKEKTLPAWCEWAHRRGLVCHIARVNTARRIEMCLAAKADSADGTAIARGHRRALRAVIGSMRRAATEPLLW